MDSDIQSEKTKTHFRKVKEEPTEIDKKRVFIGLIVLAVVLVATLIWTKNNPPKFANQSLQKQKEGAGQVAGAADSNFNLSDKQEAVQKQVNDIKENITKLKVDDLKDQDTVKKILNDLDGLVQQASQSAKVLDVKGNLCEEIKKRFCE